MVKKQVSKVPLHWRWYFWPVSHFISFHQRLHKDLWRIKLYLEVLFLPVLALLRLWVLQKVYCLSETHFSKRQKLRNWLNQSPNKYSALQYYSRSLEVFQKIHIESKIQHWFFTHKKVTHATDYPRALHETSFSMMKSLRNQDVK